MGYADKRLGYKKENHYKNGAVFFGFLVLLL
jgi:hypothetical protein